MSDLCLPKIISGRNGGEPRQDWDGDNDTCPLDCPTQGPVFSQRQVRADLIVVFCGFGRNSLAAASRDVVVLRVISYPRARSVHGSRSLEGEGSEWVIECSQTLHLTKGEWQ